MDEKQTSISSWFEEEDNLWYDDGDVEEDFLALPLSERLSSLPPVTRVVWMVKSDNQVVFGQPEEHHVDLGFEGDEPAMGDVMVGVDSNYTDDPGQRTLRVLDLSPDYDFEWVARTVEAKWNVLYPGEPITKIKNATIQAAGYRADEAVPLDFYNPATRGLTNEGAYDILHPMSEFNNHLSDPEHVDGWDVYQMESGEYNHHHAIVIDRNHKRLYINYNGHHSPLLDAATKIGIPYDEFYNTIQGHYRLEPSKTEPFKEGWGFHHGEATPDELQILGAPIKIYHKVAHLEDAWVGNKPATIMWYKVCSKALTTEVNWRAVWSRDDNTLYLWNTCGDESHHAQELNDTLFPGEVFKNGNVKKANGYVQAEGTYTTVSFVIAPGSSDPISDTEKVKGLLMKALIERYPAAIKETNFHVDVPQEVPLRFMVHKAGTVVLGHFPTHFALMEASNEDLGNFITGGFIKKNGIIELIHTPGEPDFDPESIASNVYLSAYHSGEYVSGDVIYKDWREPDGKEYDFYVNP